MIRVSMEVRDGTDLSRATVQAESIREAVNLTRGRFPDRDVRVMFPINPEDFFIDVPAQDNSRATLSDNQHARDQGELDGRDSIYPSERRGGQQDA